MKLKAIVASLTDVPAEFHVLYTERNGQFEMTGVDGMKTQADIDRIQVSLVKERNDHKALKDKVATLGRPIEEIIPILDKVPELEAAAKGNIDEGKINEIVESRIKVRIAPLEREKQTLTEKVNELTGTVGKYEKRETMRSIGDTVRGAAVKAKVVDSAIEDINLLAERVFEIDETGRVTAKEGVGCTPGITPEVWLTEMQDKRPHWWGPSTGGGARGNAGGCGGGVNPFTAANWNMTEQGRIYTENPARAEQLAKSAGTTIGGPKPAK